jgi:large subunit ribosomal protein L35
MRDKMHNKIKTNSGAKKRFKLTKSGKVKRANAGKSHLLECKTSKRKRQLRKSTIESSVMEKKIKMMMPYA